jgi:6-phosphogluconolactonase
MTTRSVCFGSDRVILVRVLIGTISLKWGDVMKRVTSLLGAFLLLGVLAGCGGGGSNTGNSGNNGAPAPVAPAAATQFLYVSDTIGELFGFSIDANSGALSPIRSGNPMDVVGVGFAGVVRIAADPNGNDLYVARAALDGGPNLIVLFLMPDGSGNLGTWSDLGQALTIPPGKLAVDPSSKNLYLIPDPSANLDEILSFSIAPGTPHSPHLVPLSTPVTGVSGVPTDITVDPSGHYVYVTFAGAPGMQVAGYSRDQTMGALTNLPSSPFSNTGGNDSQGIRITPSGTFAVIANAATNDVSVMSLNAGTLTNVSGSPFPAGASPLSVAIDPSSKFVFGANQGDNTLSAYAIGPGGELTAISGSPFTVGSQPQGVTVDLSGKFVYVASADGNVWGFTLNSGTGSLTPITGSPFHANGTLRDIVVLKP